MNKTKAGALLLLAALLIPQFATAGVFMCVDPATGKKTFTDRACPTQGQGKKVRVDPTNFGDGSRSKQKTVNNNAWRSQEDRSVSGRANFTERSHSVAATVRSTSPLNTGS